MIIGAVICAVGAIVIVYMMMQNAEAEAAANMKRLKEDLRKEFEAERGTDQPVQIQTEMDMRNVVYATQDISANNRIEGVFLEVKPTPVDLMPNAYEDPNDVIGKFARRNIRPDEPLTPDNVAKEFQKMSNRLTPGMRAIALPVIARGDATGGFSTDGDRVDLLLTYNDPPGSKNTKTRTIMQNVKILFMPAAGNYRNDQTEGVMPANSPEIPVTTTFEVTPTQAEALIALTQSGTLNMILRHKDDQVPIRSQGVDSNQIYNNPASINQQAQRSMRKIKEVQDKINQSSTTPPVQPDEATPPPTRNETILQP